MPCKIALQTIKVLYNKTLIVSESSYLDGFFKATWFRKVRDHIISVCMNVIILYILKLCQMFLRNCGQQHYSPLCQTKQVQNISTMRNVATCDTDHICVIDLLCVADWQWYTSSKKDKSIWILYPIQLQHGQQLSTVDSMIRVSAVTKLIFHVNPSQISLNLYDAKKRSRDFTTIRRLSLKIIISIAE